MKPINIWDAVKFTTICSLLVAILFTAGKVRQDISNVSIQQQHIRGEHSVIYSQIMLQQNMLNKCTNNLNYTDNTLSKLGQQDLQERLVWQF